MGSFVRACCALAATAALFTGAAHAAVEADQDALRLYDPAKDVAWGGAGFGTFTDWMSGARETSMLGQSITAGKSGYLDHVEFQFFRNMVDALPEGLVTIRLYDGNLATGSATLIFTGEFGADIFPHYTYPSITPDSAQYVQFDVRGANYLVTPGQIFSVTIDYVPDGAEIASAYAISQITSSDGTIVLDPYAGGTSFYGDSRNPGAVFADRSDIGFRSFVDVTAVPEPASWALMIGGFALAGGTLRGRRRVAIA